VSAAARALSNASEAKLLGAERRSDPRIAADLRVEILSQGFNGALPARTRDLSIGGVCLATPSPIAVGSVRGVHVVLPEGSVSLRAVGTWQRAHPTLGTILTGVRFDGVEPSAQDFLWEFVLKEGRQLARFFHLHTAIEGVGIDGAIGLAHVTRLCLPSAGDVVYRQQSGSSSGSIYVVVEGSIVLQMRVNAARMQDFAVLRRGDVFGGSWMPTHGDDEELAVARSHSRLLEIDERALDYLSSSSPWLAQALIAAATGATAHRLRGALRKLGASD
jgi:hypothetical protein